jgi:hypothetical protein
MMVQVRGTSQYRLNINGIPISVCTSNSTGYSGIYSFLFERGGYYIISAFDLLHIENANYIDFDCIVLYI